jgi:hypothetical protein
VQLAFTELHFTGYLLAGSFAQPFPNCALKNNELIAVENI